MVLSSTLDDIRGKIIDLTIQGEALAQHMAQDLNVKSQTLMLLLDETSQMRKMAFQNHMALDLLTTVQGSIYALMHIEYCIYIPDH